MDGLLEKPKVAVFLSFILGCLIGAALCHFFWADRAYRSGYNKAITNLKHQFERVMKENTMFYSEEVGAVFVSKGGDTFEVVIPQAGQEKKGN